MKMICPICKGKCYLFKWDSLMFTIYLPLVWFIEKTGHPDDAVCTQERCWRCEGEGIINV